MATRKRYNVVFYGEITEGYSVEEVRKNLSSQFNLDDELNERLLAGKSVILRENVDIQAASKLQTTGELMGAICHTELLRVDTEYGAVDVDRLCNVEFWGEIIIGQNIEDVKKKLSVLFKADRQTINQLFTGKPVIIKNNVDYQTSLDIQAAFAQTGAICRIRASNKRLSEEQAFKENIFLPTNLEKMICPQCGFKQKISSSCAKCGIIVQKFAKKKQENVEFEEPQEKNVRGVNVEELQQALEYEKEPRKDIEGTSDDVTAEEEIGGREILIWQVWLPGTLIVPLLFSLVGVDLHKIALPFDQVIAPGSFFPLLLSNFRVCGIVGLIFPILVYVWKQGRDFPALHTILIAFVVLPSLGILLVGLFTRNLFFLWLLASAYKAIGFSAFMYLIGFLIFLALRSTESLISPTNRT
jgi:hypothetical protein